MPRVVHYEFVPVGHTMYDAFYLEVLRRLKRTVNQSSLEIGNSITAMHPATPAPK